MRSYATFWRSCAGVIAGQFFGGPRPANYDAELELRERLVHVVDARIKAGVLRLLEEPAGDLVSAGIGR